MNTDCSSGPDFENLIPVGDFDSLAEAEEYALVVLAMGLACWIVESHGDSQSTEILADRCQADSIREEFAAYASEQIEPKVASPDSPVFGDGVELVCVWVLALIVTFHFQSQEPAMADWFTNSSLGLIDQGQWWRPFTALFLHADFGHLLGNAVLGAGLFLLVASSVGPWTGGALILASGTLGNVLSAWTHYPAPFQSMGSSTAVFGALGILVGLGNFRAWNSPARHKAGGVMIPLGAGIILLGWFGAGAPPTDVLSHLLGFVVGGILGWTTAGRRH